MIFDGPGGFGWYGHLFANIIGGLIWFFVFLVVVGLIFLLVRFLLVGTRAAQLYIERHAPARTETAAPAAGPTTTTTTPTAAGTKPAPTKPATTATAPTKPATKPRTPKTPPA